MSGKRYPPEVVDYIMLHGPEMPTSKLRAELKERFGFEILNDGRLADWKIRHGIYREIYPSQILDYVQNHHDNKTPSMMADEIERIFGTRFTKDQIHGLYMRYGIHTGNPRYQKQRFTKLFSEEVIAFIRQNHVGVLPKEMAKLVNEHFGTNYTGAQIKNRYDTDGLSSGEKGPHEQEKQRKPIGYERKTADGTVYVKVSNDNKRRFKPKHIVVWETANGPLPPSSVLVFLDGDKTNCTIDNLRLVSRVENGYLTRMDRADATPETMETRVLLAKVKAVIGSHEKNGKKRRDN